MNAGFAEALLAWYDESRRALPWRGETDPYRIWLSEIMLQQTRTETVERYYRAFLERFPTVRDLAAASEDEVLKLWEGMGYYSRARNLRRAARMVAGELNGEFPPTAEGLRTLPGVGPYASCAIASIAYGERVPALDGNQARVLSRALAYESVLRAPSDLWDEALALVPQARPGDYNQALMDLGASICAPVKPRCADCPVSGFCAARAEGDPEDYPRLPPPIVKRQEERTVVLAMVGDRILTRRRPAKGLLGGLWEFPNYEGALDGDSLVRALTEDGVRGAAWEAELPAARHVFTHIVWNMRGAQLRAEAFPEDWRAVDAEGLNALAMPSAFRKYRRIAEELLNKQKA